MAMLYGISVVIASNFYIVASQYFCIYLFAGLVLSQKYIFMKCISRRLAD